MKVSTSIAKPVINNLVAKHANKFCRAATHKNKKKDYARTLRNQGSKKNWALD